MASLARDNGDDTACDKCGAPASWAETSTSNLSWKQSLNHHLDTYFMSPRMWPIGYIIQSPYSPFRLEMDMSAHKSWRDAFEDLLALESNGQMISQESRNREAEIAKRVNYDGISRHVSIINDRLKSDAKGISVLKRLQSFDARNNRAKNDKSIGEAIKVQEEHSKFLIAAGKGMIATLEEQRGKSRPASAYKMRTQWMASLISSGALSGWRAQVFDSSEGSQVWLSKIDGDPDDADGQMMTEAELAKQFEEGNPIQLGSPSWSTDAGRYPESIRAELTDGEDITSVEYRIPSVRPSILSQTIAAECKRSGKGSISTKVALRNVFTDGAIEQKEIVDDPSKVLEETDRVYASMETRNGAVGTAVQEAQFDILERQLEHDENIELD